MLRPCSCLTAKRIPCPINADRERDGVWFCHVHDPLGECQRKLKKPRDASAMVRDWTLDVAWALATEFDKVVADAGRMPTRILPLEVTDRNTPTGVLITVTQTLDFSAPHSAGRP